MDEQVGAKRCCCGEIVGEYDIVCPKCGAGLVPKSLTEIIVSNAPGICVALNMIGVLSIIAAFILFGLAWKSSVDATGVGTPYFELGCAALIAAVPYFALSHLCKQSHLQTEQLTRQTLFLARIAEKIDERTK
jgi:hypothetical protein